MQSYCPATSDLRQHRAGAKLPRGGRASGPAPRRRTAIRGRWDRRPPRLPMARPASRRTAGATRPGARVGTACRTPSGPMRTPTRSRPGRPGCQRSSLRPQSPRSGNWSPSRGGRGLANCQVRVRFRRLFWGGRSNRGSHRRAARPTGRTDIEVRSTDRFAAGRQASDATLGMPYTTWGDRRRDPWYEVPREVPGRDASPSPLLAQPKPAGVQWEAGSIFRLEDGHHGRVSPRADYVDAVGSGINGQRMAAKESRCIFQDVIGVRSIFLDNDHCRSRVRSIHAFQRGIVTDASTQEPMGTDATTRPLSSSRTTKASLLHTTKRR